MEQTNLTSTKPKKIKLDFKDSKYATGRRKRSIAKVWVKKGSGNIHVNGLKMNEYFKRPVHQIIVVRPLEISEVASNYDVKLWPLLKVVDCQVRQVLLSSGYQKL